MRYDENRKIAESKNKTVGSVTGQKASPSGLEDIDFLEDCSTIRKIYAHMFYDEDIDFLFDDIAKTHFPKGKLNKLNIRKWQGELGPPENPLPSSHYRKIANIKNKKLDKIKINKK